MGYRSNLFIQTNGNYHLLYLLRSNQRLVEIPKPNLYHQCWLCFISCLPKSESVKIELATEPERLSPKLIDSIVNRQNTLFLSLVSIWGIQIKVALGKLDLITDLKATLDIQIAENSLELLTIDLQHIYAPSNLPPHHRDPFDRLLIAQSQVEQMTLATVDRAFELYEIDRLY